MSETTSSSAGKHLEITPRVIVLGLILSVVMGAANVYVGLKAGMTVSASIPAAVMAMLLFKVLFRNSSILEANQVQTCASAGESLAAGIIFTMPAMILIGYWDSFDFWAVSMVALTGGLLGILFMIPMRKVFVVNNPDLAYPEGVACAAVLEAGEESTDGEETSEGMSLISGGLLGAAFAVLSKFVGLIYGTLESATAFGSRIFYFGGDLSPMLVAVGFIVRLNVAVLIFVGGAISWLIGIPLYGAADQFENPIDGAYGIWSSKMRYVGVGAMVVGGFASLISVRHGLKAAVTELWTSLRSDGVQDDGQRDISATKILIIAGACMVMLAIINYQFTGGFAITTLATVIMLLMGFFFTAVASYIVGLVGNSNSPVSGMTITSVLVAGGLLWLFNYSGIDAMVATLGIAAVVCCVACTSGDVCNDLKTGSLVGAAPFRQQIMQVAGVCVAAFVMAPVLTLLHNNTEGGIGGRELSAPQASLFAQLARGFFDENGESLPWTLIGVGAMIGIVILCIDTVLKLQKAKFRAHLMPIAVGMYLPFGIATPIFVGGLLAYFISRKRPAEEHDRLLHRGVLFSSGVIAGEALTSVGLACLAALGVQSLDLPLEPWAVTVLSVVAAAAAVGCFILFTKPKK
jgi:putative OPT family oligopeptide transporter